MPALLDQLLDVEGPSHKAIQKQLEGLEKLDVEFLMLGLTYYISRQQDSVRLSTSIIVKNYCKAKSKEEDRDSEKDKEKDKEGDSDKDESKEEEEEEEEETKSTEKGAGGHAVPLKLGLVGQA